MEHVYGVDQYQRYLSRLRESLSILQTSPDIFDMRQDCACNLSISPMYFCIDIRSAEGGVVHFCH